MIEFSQLEPDEFELLVGLLLLVEGFGITSTPVDHSLGLTDFETRSPDGVLTFVEVKHFRKSNRLPESILRSAIAQLSRQRTQYPGSRILLVTSGTLSDLAKSRMDKEPQLAVWTGEYIQGLIGNHRGILSTFERARADRAELRNQFSLLKQPIAEVTSYSAKVADELKGIPHGIPGWRQYEQFGARVLTELFKSALGAPDLQNRSEDGLDIMDAVFPIKAGVPPWSVVRSEYQSRFAVAEFKNNVEKIGQKQVESISQYLWKKAYRSFGLLVSRRGPDHSALLARRRAWVEQDKLVVFLSDEDLIDMAQVMEERDDPFQVIDAQLEEFFRRLTP